MPDDPLENGPGPPGNVSRETLADLPELQPDTWPGNAVVEADDIPLFDPDKQALQIRDWEEEGGEMHPEIVTLPRETWAREAAHHDAARTVLETLTERFSEGFKVWVVPPDPADIDDVGQVVVGYVIAPNGGSDTAPEFSMADLNEVLPDAVDGTAGRGTSHEYTVENIPVVLERTIE